MSEIGSKIIAEALRLADENPDFVYEAPDGDQCVYVHNGAPSCLIGHALWNLGLIGPEFEHVSAEYGDRIFPIRPNQESVRLTAWYLKLDLDDREVDYLSALQYAQDNNHPWGELRQRVAARMGVGE